MQPKARPHVSETLDLKVIREYVEQTEGKIIRSDAAALLDLAERQRQQISLIQAALGTILTFAEITRLEGIDDPIEITNAVVRVLERQQAEIERLKDIIDGLAPRTILSESLKEPPEKCFRKESP